MATTAYKPASIPVFPPHANPAGDSVLHRLLQREPRRAELLWPVGFAGGIAHRLDVDTSGAILIADDPNELKKLRTAFADGHLTKTYRLLASRTVPWNENSCDRPIAHDRRRRKRMIVQRGEHTPHRGRWHPATTHFHRLEGSLFEAVMHTGVMHQIRAHAAFLGIPIHGDRTYGGGADPSGHRLHHVGLSGPQGLHTEPIPLPEWAQTAAERRANIVDF